MAFDSKAWLATQQEQLYNQLRAKIKEASQPALQKQQAELDAATSAYNDAKATADASKQAADDFAKKYPQPSMASEVARQKQVADQKAASASRIQSYIVPIQTKVTKVQSQIQNSMDNLGYVVPPGQTMDWLQQNISKPVQDWSSNKMAQSVAAQKQFEAEDTARLKLNNVISGVAAHGYSDMSGRTPSGQPYAVEQDPMQKLAAAVAPYVPEGKTPQQIIAETMGPEWLKTQNQVASERDVLLREQGQNLINKDVTNMQQRAQEKGDLVMFLGVVGGIVAAGMLGPAIGSVLGTSTSVSNAIANALVNSSITGATGGDVGDAALSSLIGSGVGELVGGAASLMSGGGSASSVQNIGASLDVDSLQTFDVGSLKGLNDSLSSNFSTGLSTSSLQNAATSLGLSADVASKLTSSSLAQALGASSSSGIGDAISAALTGGIKSAVVGAVTNAAVAGLTGGDAGKAALSGAVGGMVGGVSKGLMGPSGLDLAKPVANILSGTLSSAITAGVMGGDLGKGALTGLLSSAGGEALGYLGGKLPGGSVSAALHNSLGIPNFVSEALTNALVGGAASAITGQDPLQGALIAGGGSLVGAGVNEIGKQISGALNPTPADSGVGLKMPSGGPVNSLAELMNEGLGSNLNTKQGITMDTLANTPPTIEGMGAGGLVIPAGTNVWGAPTTQNINQNGTYKSLLDTLAPADQFKGLDPVNLSPPYKPDFTTLAPEGVELKTGLKMPTGGQVNSLQELLDKGLGANLNTGQGLSLDTPPGGPGLNIKLPDGTYLTQAGVVQPLSQTALQPDFPGLTQTDALLKKLGVKAGSALAQALLGDGSSGAPTGTNVGAGGGTSGIGSWLAGLLGGGSGGGQGLSAGTGPQYRIGMGVQTPQQAYTPIQTQGFAPVEQAFANLLQGGVYDYGPLQAAQPPQQPAPMDWQWV